MKKFCISFTASALLLASCSQQHDTKLQEHAGANKQSEQIEVRQVKQKGTNQQNNQQMSKNDNNNESAIDADEHFLEDLKGQYKTTEKQDVTLQLDGRNINTTPSPFVSGNDVYIPLSSVSTHFEAGVIYNKESNTIGIHRGNTDIDMAIGSDKAKVNGQQVDSPPIIKEDEGIFIPVTFLAKSLGYTVKKNEQSKEVKIEAHQPDQETFGFKGFETKDMDDLSMAVQATPQQTYSVQAGDSLSVIARRFNTTVEELKRLNNLTTDVIQIGKILTVTATKPTTYTVVSGDTLFLLSRRFDMTVDEIRKLNHLTSDVLRIGQTLTIAGQGQTPTPTSDTKDEQQTTYTVQSGDSLSVIAKRYNVTIEELRRLNNLSTDVIQIGQTLTITSQTTSETPSENNQQQTYTVVAGDSLSVIAKRFHTTTDELKKLNNLTSDLLKIGQTLVISQQTNTNTEAQTYTVVAGDSLSAIAKRFNTTIEDLRRLNNLTSDLIRIGQSLTVSGQGETQNTTQTSNQQGVTVSYKTHTVQSGDNLWNLSVKYGIPMLELAKENNLSINSTLSIGQQLKIPVYRVPVKSVVSSRHGELLDWWTEGRYVFPIGSEATITDFQTGRTFRVKHTMGGNHADSEPLTSTDAQRMKEIWGGQFSWTPRAVIISVNGRRLAAAMHSFPHSLQDIKNNNYNGHFCIHFLNSTRHNDGLVQDSMQRQVRISAGVN